MEVDEWKTVDGGCVVMFVKELFVSVESWQKRNQSLESGRYELTRGLFKMNDVLRVYI